MKGRGWKSVTLKQPLYRTSGRSGRVRLGGFDVRGGVRAAEELFDAVLDRARKVVCIANGHLTRHLQVKVGMTPDGHPTPEFLGGLTANP